MNLSIFAVPWQSQETSRMEDHFVDLVKECRKKKDPRFIYNASCEHAKVLVENLLEAARESKDPVRIVSGNLREEFYDSFTDKVKDLDVYIIVLNSTVDLANNAFAKMAKNLKQAATKGYFKYPHFILVGENKFRLETNHEEAKAMASFNNPEVGRVLLAQFEKLSEAISA